MKIISHTQNELVVEDNSAWLSYIMGTAAAVIVFFSVTQHQLRGLYGAACFLLFALIVDRRITFTFDAARRVVRWKGMKMFRNESGSISFDDITDIGTETASSTGGGTTYRLTILTPNGAVAMAYAYAGRNDAYAPLRLQILDFIKPGSHASSGEAGAPSHGLPADLESSIRSLLEQGRKIDAIKLLRSTQQLGLTDAVNRVEEMDRAMKTRA
jgi:hypothetical protein